ncbi:sporulation integral membrane protein YtvI [Ornithinibacillus xuwenensis]|uniref:Sporulation integral membrane protein YtvI n=1 Tax=Ornithinibacillus xuwenensis TaxID=3144668 RepID=A0ABU9XBE8_9BACI
MYKQLLEQLLRGGLVVLICITLYFLARFSIGYIYPFLIAFFIAALLNPTVTYIENHLNFPRTLATLTVIISIFLTFIGLLILMITEIIQGTSYITERLPKYLHSFTEISERILAEHVLPFYQKVASFFKSLDPSHQSTIQENIMQFLENIANTITQLIQSALLEIPTIVGFLPDSLTLLIFIILATFIITNDWYNLTEKLKVFLPQNILVFIYDFQKGIKKAFSGYLKAQLILILISATIIFVGLLILGIKHALTIAVLAALVDLLPFIGTGLLFIPWIMYSFITADFTMTIGVSVLYMTVIVVRQMIEPKIISASIGVNPLMSLIILFVALQLWGIIGVLLAPFILITLFVLYESRVFIKLVNFIKG